MTKDEAIHKALRVLNCLNNDRVYETAWVKGAINACEKALEQPERPTNAVLVPADKLKDMQRRLSDCEEYLKEDETPAECIARNRKDASTSLEMLAKCMREKKALEQPDCNSHPKAPHGFNRDASHSADRYVCDCEGWDAWQDGYEKGLREGLAIEQSALTDEKGRPMTYWGGLDQPAQEPVAWIDHMDGIKTVVWKERDYPAIGTKLYTHPTQPCKECKHDK